MICAFAQTKGGVGKSTLAVNLAVERSIRAKKRVLLLDADEQGTAADFASFRAERLGQAGFDVLQAYGADLRQQVLTQREQYHDIIIDVGGRDTGSLRAALTVAEVAVIPFQPRSFDVWTLGKMVELLEEARTINPTLRGVAVINCADTQGGDNDAAAEALRETAILSFLPAKLVRRKAFPNCNSLGLSVLEGQPKDRKACQELEHFADQLDRFYAATAV